MAASTTQKINFASDQEVRWCPGCGDFSILAQMKKLLPTLGVAPENIAFVSGIGCSSRFPYYLETYGLHGIHGRAPSIATGLKRMRPDLQTWVVTGDGDALSIGASHLIHALRRNVDIKILLFNNRVYGLTKGQFSPTSLPGQVSSSTPLGTTHKAFNPLSLALASHATFVARTVDTHAKHLTEVLRRAAEHKGSAFVEIYQNCHIFNDKAFEFARDKTLRDEHIIELQQGKPLLFGKERNKAIRINGAKPEIVTVNEDCQISGLPVHDEQADTPVMANILAGMSHPEMPEVMGVLRAIKSATHNDRMPDKDPDAGTRKTKLVELLQAGNTWVVD